MQTALFTSAAAIDVHEKRQELTAANLANISTPGYRRRIQVFEAIDAMPRISVAIDFTPGDAVHTGNPLDLALSGSDGNAFFALTGPGRSEVYARTLRLAVSPEGSLVHASSGYALAQPNGAPIRLNPAGGAIQVDGRGAVSQDGRAIGRIKVIRFDRLDRVEALDRGLFAPGKGDGVASAEGLAEVRQSHLETSNADSVDELVEMIANYRAYEASNKALKQTDNTVRTLIRQTTR